MASPRPPSRSGKPGTFFLRHWHPLAAHAAEILLERIRGDEWVLGHKLPVA
ncbi:hypothetical protein [Amycolatopsis benzoatilytica]|uniref:hypothetical protein n=1 Tax=Amycolatopsis benzoatilytica TaxID=346045 RepID=UPI000381B774|nr:hypothetical protein [Amycolatopsis benzoatilytica]